MWCGYVQYLGKQHIFLIYVFLCLWANLDTQEIWHAAAQESVFSHVFFKKRCKDCNLIKSIMLHAFILENDTNSQKTTKENAQQWKHQCFTCKAQCNSTYFHKHFCRYLCIYRNNLIERERGETNKQTNQEEIIYLHKKGLTY